MCGTLLPGVEKVTILGHELDDFDASCNRAEFIAKSLVIRTLLQWVSPEEVLRALKISFYIPKFWDLAGEKARQVCNVSVKLPQGNKDIPNSSCS